jgi:hypothetical protein
MFNLSYSKIKRFLLCPFLYEWTDIEQKEFFHNERYIEKIIISHTIEKYLLHLSMNKKKIDLDYIDFLFDRIWAFGVDKLLDEELFQNLKKILLNYCNQNINLNNVYKIGLFDSFNLSPWEVRIGVRFARIDKRKNKIIVYDYKTGKDENMVRDYNKDLWLQIYTLGLYYIFGAFDKYSIIRINLTTGNQFKLKIGPKEEMESIIIKHVDRLLWAEYFNPRENQFCDFCYIQKIGECVLHKNEK